MNIVDFIFSLISNFIILYYFKKSNYSVLLLFPLFAFSGRWLASFTEIPNSVYFGYIEFVLSLIIFYKYRNISRSKYLIFIFPFLSISSLLYINNNERYVIFFFYFFLLISANGYYALFSRNMGKLIKTAIIDKILIVWMILGIYFRISVANQFNMTFLEARGGSSLWTTNHISMIILLFLPLVKNKYVLYSSIFFLCIQFSRGAYFTLLLMLLLYFILGYSRKVIKTSIVSLTLVVGFFFFAKILSPQFIDRGVLLLRERLTRELNFSYTSKPLNAITYSSIKRGIEIDEREEIRKAAWEISKLTNYNGIGLGNFIDGLQRINYPSKVSNAHNLYLTLLSEGGLLFILIFLFIMLKLLILSYQYDWRVLISLICFLFYGFFNGQIYEESAFRSCIDYFYLIFIWAYLMYRRRNFFLYQQRTY